MPRASIVLNAALGLIALLAVAYVVRELRAPAPMPSAARRPAPAPAPVSVTPPPPAPVTPPGGYNVVAARNLFSPTRSESPVSPAAAGKVQREVEGHAEREGEQQEWHYRLLCIHGPRIVEFGRIGYPRPSPDGMEKAF